MNKKVSRHRSPTEAIDLTGLLRAFRASPEAQRLAQQGRAVSCLTPPQLAKFDAGELSEEENRQIRRHLLFCTACSRRLSTQRNPARAHALTRVPSAAPADALEEGLAWNVLNQILQPMILILAILLFFKLADYRQVAEGYKTANEEKERTIKRLKDYATGGMLEKLNEALLELQRQKLIIALGEVKKAEEERLHLSPYIHGSIAIRLDTSFKAVCEQTYRIFSSAQNRRRAEQELYRQVLTQSQLKDDPARGESVEERQEFIAPGNRTYVKSEIEKFLTAVEARTKSLQMSIMKQKFEETITNPARHLSPRIKDLAQQLRAEWAKGPAGNPRPYLRELLNHSAEALKAELANNGYTFLPQTWQDITLTL